MQGCNSVLSLVEATSIKNENNFVVSCVINKFQKYINNSIFSPFIDFNLFYII